MKWLEDNEPESWLSGTSSLCRRIMTYMNRFPLTIAATMEKPLLLYLQNAC